MRRREFVTEPITALLASEPPPAIPGHHTLLRFSRRAMATRFEVALPIGTPNALAAAEAALDEIDSCEEWMTVYSDDSEVSRVNREAFEQPIEVTQPLFDLLSLSADLSNLTGGSFDPACGSMIIAWGFYRREGRLPTPAERSAAMIASGMRHVALDSTNRTVKFLRPGLQLNFGGIGKGFALDRAASILANQFGITAALLHGGGSSVRAIGRWPIQINHPDGDGRSLGTVRLSHCGFGTSAATFQFFEYNGKRYGHLLDPRSGRPAAGVASASVTAASAAIADALSTAAFVLGALDFVGVMRSFADSGALILEEDGRITRLGTMTESARLTNSPL